jgi:hypothetical protein
LPDTLTLNAADVVVVVGGVVVVVVGGGVLVVVVGGGVVVVGGGVVVVVVVVGDVVVGIGFGLWDLVVACDVVPRVAPATVGAITASPAELPMINRMAGSDFRR